MKGPNERLKYDLRRLWECPVCKRRERTAGTVTYRHCQCQMKQIDGKPVVMKLLEDHVQRVTAPVVIQHEPLAAPAVAEEPPASVEPPPPLDLPVNPPEAEPPEDDSRVPGREGF
jgi:hypothetical protein